MPCYRPLDAWLLPPHLGGGITFRRTDTWVDRNMHVLLPCTKCIGCRLDYARNWAVRCVHEAQLHERNCYLTLTYAEHRLPADRSVRVRELQLFFKRYRRWLGERKIRYFACGEYGDITGRPHYHALVFGHDFDDRKLLKMHNGNPLFTSEKAQELWSDEHGSIGHVTLGAVSFQSAAYVARYIMKKQSGDRAEAHYNGRKSEFVIMSRKPGLGRKWIERYYGDVYPHDEFHLDGKRHRPPRFYDEFYAEIDPEGFADLKARRIREGRAFADHPSRLAVKEKVKEARTALLVRPHE